MEAQRSREVHRRQAQLLSSSLVRLDAESWKQGALKLLSLGGVISVAAVGALSPNGPGTCDHNPFERCANCCTSVPYLACGVHTMRNRRTVAGKAWGMSLLGVGVSSTVFHASSGKIRPACRKVDFWSIAAASNIMLRAVFPNVPPAVTALGLAITPFRPFLVSTCCTTAMELKYLVQAYRKPHLRQPQRLHAAACLLGLACFVTEDLCPKVPLMHAAWHCLSAGAVATINHLVADVEDEYLATQRAVISPSTLPAGAAQPMWSSCDQLVA